MSRSGTNTSSPDSNGKSGAFAGLNSMLMQAVEGGNFKTGLTPAGMGTPGAEGVSPLPTQLGGGLVTGAGGSLNGSLMKHQQAGDQEEERKMRLETIVKLLGQRWGYVSREGVERFARRVGLECLWEDEIPGTEGRTLSIAGNSVLAEVTFLRGGDEVRSVQLGFPEREDGEWSRSAGIGAQVLERDLKGKEGEWGYVGLEPFVRNLERLARLDRLRTEGVSCFDAVEGVGGALRKVWEIETRKRRAKNRDERQEDLELDVLCEESGKPTMHAGGRLGLAQQYWTERRYATGRKRKSDEMDIDSSPEDAAIEETTSYSATIECEPSSAELYPSIRVSDAWVIEAADKPPTQQQQQDPFTTVNNDNDSPYIWQDPPPTLITPSPSAPDAMNIDTDLNSLNQQNKPPDVRFVARLNTPVLVPLQTALNIYESLGVPISQESIQPTTFDSLLLPDENGTPSPSNTERSATREIFTPCTDDDNEDERKSKGKTHEYTLFPEPQVYARNIEDIPFSHPRQLIALLPVLRQWAYLGSLLRRCFGTNSSFSNATSTLDRQSTSTTTSSPETSSPSSDSESLTPTSDLASPPPSPQQQTRAIDISLSISSPQPRISLTFSLPKGLVDVSFSVGPNAEVGDVDFSLSGTEERKEERQTQEHGDKDGDRDDGKSMERKEKIKRVLEVSEDLGVLVEWIAGRD